MTTLARAAERQQDAVLARADRSADAAERVVRGVWLKLLAVMKAGGHWGQVYHAALAVLRGLPAAAHVVAADLVEAGKDARATTRRLIVRHVPAARLVPRLARHLTRLPALAPTAPGGLLEDEHDPPAAALLELLPGPSDDAIRRVVYAAGWVQRLQSLTALAQPEHLAATIASGAAQGLSALELARQVRPLVQGVQTSARRVARTAGLWVAHAVEHQQLEEGLGDLIEGWKVNAVLDHATRPEHRKRDGTVYWKRPRPGQKGTGEMPHPPREYDGSWSFNCRCWLSPELAAV